MATVENLSSFPKSRILFEEASSILQYDLLKICETGPKEILDSTAVCQPAIFVSSMAAMEKLRALNPSAVGDASCAMGLSLGEYSALCFAGCFSFADGVRLTQARGKAMQEASDVTPRGMLGVVGLP
jgi:[acyl-carrier-protein] S-malonyltransferase